MHGQVGDCGGSHQPAASVSIPSGRAVRAVAGWDGVKTQGELLVDAAVGVDQNVAGVAVDPGNRREFDRDPGFLGDLADDRLPGRLADLDPAAGKLPVAVVDAADQQDLTSGVADRRERGRQQVVRVRGARDPGSTRAAGPRTGSWVTGSAPTSGRGRVAVAPSESSLLIRRAFTSRGGSRRRPAQRGACTS